MTQKRRNRTEEPVVVVGSGVAGGLAALLVSRTAPVVLVTKSELVSGSTALAQGGVAAATGPDDSWRRHTEETLGAAAGLGDPEVTRRICRRAPEVIDLLAGLGVDFDRDEAGQLERGKEGAHSRHRVVHAGGDATGAHISAAIARQIGDAGEIDLRERWSARELIVSESGVEGLVVLDGDGAEQTLVTSTVVLATGGYCGLYERTTVPPDVIGDGVVLAGRAGAALSDLEMVQFHPTAIALDQRPLPLATEALRGAGAALVDRDGDRFMSDHHPLAELGPRDVVARAIYEQPGHAAWLTLPGVGPEDAARRFPTVAAACRSAGLALGRDAIRVTPAAHYAIGGIQADSCGRSSVPGLYAIGECASTGLHGANRLASNSLLEGAAMAIGCAAAIEFGGSWPRGPRSRPEAPPRAGDPEDTEISTSVRQIMWERVGIVRDEAGLAEAASGLDRLRVEASGWQDHGMVALASWIVAAARARTESRGAHWRVDHPDRDPAQAQRLGWVGGHRFPIGPNPGRPRSTVKEAA